MDLDLLRTLKCGNGDEIMKLTKEKPDLFLGRSPQGNSTLHIALRSSGNENTTVVPVLQEILNIHPCLLYERNRRGQTPLHIAAAAGNAAAVNLFVDKKKTHDNETGPDSILRMQDNEGNTALHLAVGNCHLKVVQKLSAADPESVLLSVNRAGHSPLSIAIDETLTEIACWIIHNNPDSLNYQGSNQSTPLHSAVIRNNFDVMMEILKVKKKLISKVDKNHRNALHYVAASGHVEIARYLSKEEVSLIYKTDCNGQTPLHLAAKNGNLGVMKMLVKDYPDLIELLDNSQCNILHLAAQQGHQDLVSFILKLPEIEDLINAPDEHGNTPLHLAAMYFRHKVIDALSKSRKLNIKATNHEQQTALEIAQNSQKEATENYNKKYLTLKALKVTYRSRPLDSEDIIANGYMGRIINTREPNHGKIERAKKLAEVLLTLTSLVAAFTFTAALNIPAEYKYDVPRNVQYFSLKLYKRIAFELFMIFAAMSSASCVTAAIIICFLFWRASDNHKFFIKTVPVAVLLTIMGLASMAMAFVCGLIVVLSNSQTVTMRLVWVVCSLPLFFYIYFPSYIWLFQSKMSSILRGSSLRWSLTRPDKLRKKRE